MGGIACTWMRGGTSKGAFFLAADLPSDLRERDDLLLRVMGSPRSPSDRRDRGRPPTHQQGRGDQPVG